MMLFTSMTHYKHTFSISASILSRIPPTLLWMAIEHDLDSLGGRIAYVIERSGHNPASAAKLLECTPAAVYQWIDGSTKNLKQQLLWRLADLTGYEARWISLGEGPQRIPPEVQRAKNNLLAMEPHARYAVIQVIEGLSKPKGETQ